MSLRKVATGLVTIGFAAGLVGAGVSATYTDQVTAQANAVYVGSFACQLSTATPGAVVTDNGHTVTFTEPDITQSAPQQGGNALDLSITLTNTGSIAQNVHWTITGPDYNIAPYNRPPYNSPNGHFGTSAGSPSMLTDLHNFTGSQTYNSLGFMWLTPLDNTDLGVSLTATYHADCTEYSAPPPAQRPAFVGAVTGSLTTAVSTTSVVCPAGTQQAGLYPHVGVVGAYNWCGTGTSAIFPVASTAAFPSSGQFTVLGNVVAYTGVTGTAFTGLTNVSGTATAAAPGSAVTGTAPSMALPAFQPGDLAIAMINHTGTTGLITPLGWSTWSASNTWPTGRTGVFYKTLVAGDTLPGGAVETVLVAVYRHAMIGNFSSAGSGNTVSFASSAGIPALHSATGSSAITLLAADTAATNMSSFAIDGAAHRFDATNGFKWAVADTTAAAINSWAGGTFAETPNSGTRFLFIGELQYAP